MPRSRTALAVVVAFVLTVTVASQLASAALGDPRIAKCGGGDPSTTRIRDAFELSHARDFWKHFPSAPEFAPELRTDSAAFVVVFDGPVTITGTGPNGIVRATLDDVVCVLLPPSDMYPDGEPLVYYDVPLDDFVR